jgi:hypothetical protein
MRVLIPTLLAALGLAAAASADPQARPAIAVVDRAPVSVRGTGFGVRERVLVTVKSDLLQVAQRTRATSRGTFVVRFDGVRLSPCTGAALVATGARGHVATLKLSLRECPGPILEP